MQTYLPYPDCSLSACCLDDKRLLKQRLDAFAIYIALKNKKRGEIFKDPAVMMWDGSITGLMWYHNLIADRARLRGLTTELNLITEKIQPVILPRWFGDQRVHDSHKSALMKRDPHHYSIWFGDFPQNLPLLWPRLAAKVVKP